MVSNNILWCFGDFMKEFEKEKTIVKFSEVCKELNVENIYEEITKLGSPEKDYRLISVMVTMELIPYEKSFSDVLRLIADEIDKNV